MKQLGILYILNCMLRLGYLAKLFVFKTDSYFWKKRTLMLVFNFDFQNCHKFVPLFVEPSPALKNSWLRACCDWLLVIVIDSIWKIKKDCYHKYFLEEWKCKIKNIKKTRSITEDINFYCYSFLLLMAMMMILALTLTLNMIFQKFWIIYSEDLIHMNSYLIAPSNISSLLIARFDILYTTKSQRWVRINRQNFSIYSLCYTFCVCFVHCTSG